MTISTFFKSARKIYGVSSIQFSKNIYVMNNPNLLPNITQVLEYDPSADTAINKLIEN